MYITKLSWLPPFSTEFAYRLRRLHDTQPANSIARSFVASVGERWRIARSFVASVRERWEIARSFVASVGEH